MHFLGVSNHATNKFYTVTLHSDLMLYFCSRRPYHFTPLHPGSPYCAAKLGFLLLAVRGAFVLPGPQAYLEGNFTLKDEAQSWPLLCQVDHSSGQLKVFVSESAVSK